MPSFHHPHFRTGNKVKGIKVNKNFKVLVAAQAEKYMESYGIAFKLMKLHCNLMKLHVNSCNLF